MARLFKKVNTRLQEFIKKQTLFFVATAGTGGRINLSPKGMDTFELIDPNRVLWLNLTGSGNETAAHITENKRMTLMFCSFDTEPLILRLYGTASTIHKNHKNWERYLSYFKPLPGARQIIDVNIESVQTSCGFGVPLMKFVNERQTLKEWAMEKSEDELEAYWDQKNTLSIDGIETGIEQNIMNKTTDNL